MDKVTEQRPIKPAEPVITMTQQPQFAQTTATFQQVVPAKKGMSKKTKIILASVFGSLAAIFTYRWGATHYGATNQVRLRMEHMR